MSDTQTPSRGVLELDAGLAPGLVGVGAPAAWSSGYSPHSRPALSGHARGCGPGHARRRALGVERWSRRGLPWAGLALAGLSASIAQGQPAATAQPALTVPAAVPGVAASGAVGNAPPPSPLSTAAEPGAPAPGFAVQLNLDFTNAYFYRGIRQQDKGLLVQPAARVTARVGEVSGTSIDAFFGTWNSVGPNAFTRSNDAVRSWYESDLYAGLTLTHGPLSFSTSYTFLTSPSGAFQTVQELGFTAAIDDSAWMNELALKPSLTLVVETGANGSDSPDLDNGVYLELAVCPGTTFKVFETPIALTFPASVGFSVSKYYQDAQGRDGAFGFGQVGARVAIPLGGPGPCGAWTLNAGVAVLFLGDTTRAFNNGGRTEFIGTVGVQWNF